LTLGFGHELNGGGFVSAIDATLLDSLSRFVRKEMRTTPGHSAARCDGGQFS